MTENMNKPLTTSQRRAAEQLLKREEDRLWREYHERYNEHVWARAEREAREEWFEANPEVVEVIRKAERYAKRAEKRLAELVDEATAAAPSGTSFHAYISPSPLGLLNQPWKRRSENLARQLQNEQEVLHRKILAAIDNARTAILHATLGTDYDSLITLPTLDEVLA